MFSEYNPDLLHFVNVVYSGEAFVNTNLHQEMANCLKQDEIRINKIISNKDVYSDVFIEKMYNDVWVVEKGEKQSMLN